MTSSNRQASLAGPAARKGAAFLLLVAALLLVVTGVTFQAVRSESMMRQSQRERLRAETMVRALEAASPFVASVQASDEGAMTWRFTVDETQWVQVSRQTTDLGSRVVAEWVRNNEVVDMISRELDN